MSDVERRNAVNDTDVDASISVLGDGTDENNMGARSDPLKERRPAGEEGDTREGASDRDRSGSDGIEDDVNASEPDEERINTDK